jgi:cytochrome c oxidase assembly factor CtaG
VLNFLFFVIGFSIFRCELKRDTSLHNIPILNRLKTFFKQKNFLGFYCKSRQVYAVVAETAGAADVAVATGSFNLI